MSSPSEQRVSVVVCSYTLARWSVLGDAIASLEQQTVRPDEVILVVDHCAPLLRRARQAFSPTVTIVANAGEQGISDARNTGIAHATGDVVAFLDDDAVAAPDWVQRHRDAYADPEVIGVGGHVAPHWMQHRPAWFPPEFDWVIGCSHSGMPDRPSRVRNFIGANMSFRRPVLDDVGPFRTNLGRLGTIPVGCEETELCIRAGRLNESGLLYDPKTVVHQAVPATRATWSYFLHRCYAEGRSKAALSGLVGTGAGLADERTYVRRTLPKGVVRAIGTAFTRPARVLSAVAIVAGLVTTALGYLAGNRALRTTDPDLDPAPEPSTTDRKINGRPAMAQTIARSAATDGGVHLAMVTSTPLAHEETEPAGEPSARIRFHVAALITAVTCWVWSLHGIDLRAMTDLGLLSVLPLSFWLALGVLTFDFVVLVRRPKAPRWLLAAHVLALVVMLFATPTVLYGTLRFAWAWKHVGVIDYLLRNHHVNLHLGGDFTAYMGWPGFFTANAVLTQGSGFASAASYANWGPPVFEALSLLPLLLILRTFTNDRRQIWTAVWLYYLACWVGQDYLSPQAYDLFLYLTIVALCLRWLPEGPGRGRARRAEATAAPRADAPTPSQLLVLSSLLIVAMVSSHQLTPFMLLATLGAFWIFRVREVRSIFVITALCSVIWLATAGRTFLAENFWWIKMSIGHPGSNADSTFIDLGSASAGQQLIARIDRIYTPAVGLLAVAGLVRRRRAWRADLPLILLAVAPLPLLAAGSYSGEMLYRVYLFALAPVAFFAACVFFPDARRGRSSRTSAALGAVASLLLVGFVFSYLGKERMYYFTRQEVTAAEWLHDRTPSDSLLVAATANLPWEISDYERHKFVLFTEAKPQVRHQVIDEPVTGLTRLINSQGKKAAYVIFSRSQQADADMTGTLPRYSYGRIRTAVEESSRFHLVFSNRDAQIYEFAPRGTATGRAAQSTPADHTGGSR